MSRNRFILQSGDHNNCVCNFETYMNVALHAWSLFLARDQGLKFYFDILNSLGNVNNLSLFSFYVEGITLVRILTSTFEVDLLGLVTSLIRVIMYS